MFKKLILFIKNLFISNRQHYRDELITDNSYSDVAATPVSKIKSQLEKINEPVHIKVPKKPNLDHIKNINKEAIENKIKKNIFFIDNLMGKMEGFEDYISYYNKLEDLKTQSQNSLRLLFRIKEEAPYYYNTIKAIMQHTKVVSGLLTPQ